MNAKGATTCWLAAIVIVALAVGGCASVPPASPALKEQALSLKPPPGKGAVYIICPKSFLGFNALCEIRLDGQKVSHLKTGCYLYTPVWPGEHVLASASDDDDSYSHLNFVVGEGQNGFFEIGPSYSKGYVRLVDAQAGENYVSNYELSGDDFYQLPFLPGKADSAAPAACHIFLPQNDPFVAARVEQPPDNDTTDDSGTPVSGTPAQNAAEIEVAMGVGFTEGVGEGIINALINRDYAAKAKELGLPLQGHGLGDSFRTNFQSSLSSLAANSPWLHTASFEMARDYTNVSVAEVNKHPVVQINLVYALSPDASSLIARAQLLYFQQGNRKAAYIGFYTYVSEPVTAQGKNAVAIWTASDEELMRLRMSEGLRELLTMMDIDFFHREQLDPNARSVFVSFFDPLKDAQTTDRGIVLHGEGPRVIFQVQPGNIISIVPTIFPQP
jgi:hypothetical protein